MGSKSINISDRFLGILIAIALFIQYVLPHAGLGGFSTISVLIYVIVALYLIFLA